MGNVKNVADVQQIKPKKKFCFAIIPLAIYGIFFAVYSFYNHSLPVDEFISPPWLMIVMDCLIQFFAIVLMIVLLLIKVKNPALSVPFFMISVANIFPAVSQIIRHYRYLDMSLNLDPDFSGYYLDYYYEYDDMYWELIRKSEVSRCCVIFSVLASIVFFIVALCVLFAPMSRKKKVTKDLLLVSIIVTFVPGLIWFILSGDGILDEINYMHAGVYSLSTVITYFSMTVFVVLLGKWIVNSYQAEKTVEDNVQKTIPVFTEQSVKTVPITQDSPVINPSPVNRVPVTPVQNNIDKQEKNADVIRKYKELLDLGAITQEEFDEKKKEILNNK